MKPVFLIAVLNINEQTFLKICDYLNIFNTSGFITWKYSNWYRCRNTKFPISSPLSTPPQKKPKTNQKKKPKATKQREDVESAASIYRLME